MVTWLAVALVVPVLLVVGTGFAIAWLVRVLGGDGHIRHAGQPAGGGTGFRVFWLLVGMGGAALAVSLFAPSARHVSAPPQPAAMGRMSPRELQAHAAANGVVGAAAAGQRELAGAHPDRPVPVTARGPSPRPFPPPGPLPAVHISRVRSESPAASKDRALADALDVARGKVAVALAGLDPPIPEAPTAEDVRRKYLRAESVTIIPPSAEDKEAWTAAGLDPNRMWVELDVEVTADQVRELRSKGRVADAGRAMVVAFAAVLAGFAFLRLDAWTKGYLTTGLGVAAGGLLLAAVAGALLF